MNQQKSHEVQIVLLALILAFHFLYSAVDVIPAEHSYCVFTFQKSVVWIVEDQHRHLLGQALDGH